MYPNNAAFQEALELARSRAQQQAQSRQQQSQARQLRGADPPPDPPESGAPARSIQDRINDRHGMPSSQHVGNAGAAGGFSVHGRMNLGPRPGAAQGLLNQLSLRDLQQLRAQHEINAQIDRGLRGIHGGHTDSALARGAGAWRETQLELEDRWRVENGLPPRLMARGGSGAGGQYQGMASGYSNPSSPQIRARPNPEWDSEFAGRTEAKQQESEAPAASSTENTGPGVGTGRGTLFDILATAAEGQLRKENLEGKASKPAAKTPGKRGRKPKATQENTPRKDAAAILSAMNAPASVAASFPPKYNKRKRKAANEPKNPLGAFVFFQKKIMADVFEENPCITFGEAAAECGRRWKKLSDAEKQQYKDMATADKERYTKELDAFKSKGYDVPPEEPALVKPVSVTAAVKAPPAKKARKTKKITTASAQKSAAPKKPRSAFAFFKADTLKKVQEHFPLATVAEASEECLARYKKLTSNEKAKYERMAIDEKSRYEREDRPQNDKVKGKTNTEEEKGNRPVRANRLGRLKTPQKPQPQEEAIETLSGDFEAEDEAMEKAINGWSPEAVKVPAMKEYAEMVDTNEQYVEETAWRYHNPPLPPSSQDSSNVDENKTTGINVIASVMPEDLRPLPPPPSRPTDFPNTSYCRWSFDEETRVLLADFRPAEKAADVIVTLEDEEYLLKMFERDDITVVSEGLFTGLDKTKWTLDYVSRVAGNEYYHKIRRFDKEEEKSTEPSQSQKNGKQQLVTKVAPSSDEPDESSPPVGHKKEEFVEVRHKEVDRCLSMKVSDFISYLRLRGAALQNKDTDTGRRNFSFLDYLGGQHTIDVLESVLYMIDFDMVKLLPTLNEDFTSTFKMPGILPGGSHCMMNCVNPNGRPFMGPNFYVTPPGAFTHFHQDGHGTVDSGHCCLSGFNEVVMLRRLPERHKRHALRFLTGSYKRAKQPTFEALYNLPHGDGLGERPLWPDNEAIDKCNAMNYCVSRFILKEGQCVHINKGRLHAFRKVSNRPLPPTDCHHRLRNDIVRPGTNQKIVGLDKPEILCISVAWDWMYRGVTVAGIHREVVSSLECAALTRRYGVQSLAIPELSLLQMARTLAPRTDEPTASPSIYNESLIAFYDSSDETVDRGYMPSASDICKGIFGGLQYVVKRHIYAMNHAESQKSRSFEKSKRVSVAEKPNAWENPLTFALEPYGNSDFFCKLCHKELSNVYLHCDGCELLLSKDFNICLECHQEQRYMTSVQMHPLNPKRHSTINHIGNPSFDRASRCPCKNGPVCKHCHFCAGCSCRCHTWFTLNYRFFKKDDELKLLHRVKHRVGRDQLDAAEEAEQRLCMAVKGFIDENDRVNDPLNFHHCLHGNDTTGPTEEARVEDAKGEEEIEHAEDHEEKEETEHVEDSKVTGQTEQPESGVQTEQAEENKKSQKEAPEVPYFGKTEQEVTEDAYDLKASHMEDSLGDTNPLSKQEAESIPKTRRSSRRGQCNDLNPDGTSGGSSRSSFTVEERQSLEEALKKPGADWESVETCLPRRGAVQVRKFVEDNFPDLVAALEKGAIYLEDNEGVGVMAGKNPAEVIVDDLKVTIRYRDNGGETQREVLSNDTSDNASGSVESSLRPKLEYKSGRWTEDEKKRLQEALKKQPDLESVELFLGTRRISQIRSYADRQYPELWQSLKDRMAKKGNGEEEKVIVETIVENSGKWTDGEKQCLRQALESEPDLESVEQLVGTRSIPAIRSYAIRQYPELYKSLKERMERDGKELVEVQEEQKEEVPLRRPAESPWRWADDEKERLRHALENEPDLESVEQFVATRNIQSIRSFAGRNYPKLYQSLKERMAKEGHEQGEEKEQKVEIAAERGAESSRKWTEDEKQRLKQALEFEPDLKSVEKFVGSRRIPAIRTFALRQYPELYQVLKERMAKADQNQKDKAKFSGNLHVDDTRESVKNKGTEKNSLAGEKVDDVQAGIVTRRRRGAVSSTDNTFAKVVTSRSATSKSEDGSSRASNKRKGDRQPVKEETVSGDSDDDSNEIKVLSNPLSRLRKQSKAQSNLAAGNRGRRTLTQELMPRGKKQDRNSQPLDPPSDKASAKESDVNNAGNPPTAPIAKRQKIDTTGNSEDKLTEESLIGEQPKEDKKDGSEDRGLENGRKVKKESEPNAEIETHEKEKSEAKKNDGENVDRNAPESFRLFQRELAHTRRHAAKGGSKNDETMEANVKDEPKGKEGEKSLAAVEKETQKDQEGDAKEGETGSEIEKESETTKSTNSSDKVKKEPEDAIVLES